MDDKHQLDTLIGEMIAIKAFAIAMVATHPAPAQFKHALGIASEQMMTKVLNHSGVSEDLIEGLRDLTDSLESMIDQRLKP